MSLGVVIKGPEGVVLAADSRVTLGAQQQGGPAFTVNFDNATKLLSFSHPNDHVGAVTYGQAVIGLRTAHSYIPEFEIALGSDKRLDILDFTQRLSDFFMERWQNSMPADHAGPGMTFIVGGYDKSGPYAYGKVFLFEIPGHPDPEPRNSGDNEFGMTWGGQLQIASRLIHGYDPGLPSILRQTLKLDESQIGQVLEGFKQSIEFKIPYQVLPLQDCVDLATFMIRTTITAQGLAVGIRGVGGTIEVATITGTNALQYVQRKKLHGEDQV